MLPNVISTIPIALGSVFALFSAGVKANAQMSPELCAELFCEKSNIITNLVQRTIPETVHQILKTIDRGLQLNPSPYTSEPVIDQPQLKFADKDESIFNITNLSALDVNGQQNTKQCTKLTLTLELDDNHMQESTNRKQISCLIKFSQPQDLRSLKSLNLQHDQIQVSFNLVHQWGLTEAFYSNSDPTTVKIDELEFDLDKALLKRLVKQMPLVTTRRPGFIYTQSNSYPEGSLLIHISLLTPDHTSIEVDNRIITEQVIEPYPSSPPSLPLHAGH